LAYIARNAVFKVEPQGDTDQYEALAQLVGEKDEHLAKPVVPYLDFQRWEYRGGLPVE
jgi:hypothetical protein